MKITDVKVNPYEKKALRGFASITIDDEFVVTGLRILSGKKGLFVSMPSQEGRDGEYYDTCFPLNKETRDYISNEVLAAYEALDLEEDEEEDPAPRKRTATRKR